METDFQIKRSCILSVFNVKYGHQRKLNYTRHNAEKCGHVRGRSPVDYIVWGQNKSIPVF